MIHIIRFYLLPLQYVSATLQRVNAPLFENIQTKVNEYNKTIPGDSFRHAHHERY